jgi:hypothetical protein
MKDKNLIHIKFGYEEALQSKRDILYSEMNLIKISRIIKNYHSLRLEELKIKLNLHNKIKEINTYIKNLQTFFPHLKFPEILKKDEDIEEVDNSKRKIKERPHDESIEFQLQEIQGKLKSLQK